MQKRTLYILGGVGAGMGLLALASHIHAANIVRDLNDIIDKDQNSTGTFEDVKDDKGFNINYWKDVSDKKLKTIYLKVSEARAFAKRIYEDIGYTYDNETDIVSIIQSLRNKVQLSQISYYFNEEYKLSMGDYIAQHVDKGTNPEDIRKALKIMPDF